VSGGLLNDEQKGFRHFNKKQKSVLSFQQEEDLYGDF